MANVTSNIADGGDLKALLFNPPPKLIRSTQLN